MDEPYAWWGNAPVYLGDLDRSFYRDFIDRTERDHGPLVTIDDRGIARFNPIPVYTLPEWDRMPSWHENQGRMAADAIMREFPDGPWSGLPNGFWVLLSRGRSYGWSTSAEGVTSSDYSKVEVSTGVCVYEELQGVDTGKERPLSRVASVSDSRSVKRLGEDFNPYPELFAKLMREMPERWDWFVRCRRRKRWSPVPEWLLKIRADERRSRRRMSGQSRETPHGASSAVVSAS